ncbi:MAG: uracil-DNA glycosylase, partial [Aurantimonas coralicida]|nr:uracil-DNA glycosylase [Aurantimonas coralicida]
NKPVGAEINTCRQFFSGRMATFPRLAAIVTLGRIAHESTVRALGARPSAAPFGHNVHHMVGGIAVFSSYHCSRYNTNTGRLTEAMFHDVFENAAAFLKR